MRRVTTVSIDFSFTPYSKLSLSFLVPGVGYRIINLGSPVIQAFEVQVRQAQTQEGKGKQVQHHQPFNELPTALVTPHYPEYVMKPLRMSYRMGAASSSGPSSSSSPVAEVYIVEFVSACEYV